MDRYLPPEIWGTVFRFATFTATSLNVMDWDPHWSYTSPAGSGVSAWSSQTTLPTKKALTLVSRNFREMSLEYLFELVKLIHIRSAQLLLDIILSSTTRADTENSPAKWIKYIIVDLTPGSDGDLHLTKVLMKIFPFCTNLAGFGTGWKSTQRSPNAQENDLSTLMASIPLSITTLEWRRPLLPRSFHSLRNHAALRRLRVSSLSPMSPDDRNVDMPFITHLGVCIPMGYVPVSWWDLPSVVHLTLEFPEKQHFDQLISKARDNIQSIYLAEPWKCRRDDFPRILARMAKLETFSYDIIMNYPDISPSPWLGVSRHASLTHIYLFCRNGGGSRRRSFSEIRDSFSFHLQPLMTGHLMPLTISIVHTHIVFRRLDFPEGGYDAASKQRFFDDLSASLSTAQIQCVFK